MPQNLAYTNKLICINATLATACYTFLGVHQQDFGDGLWTGYAPVNQIPDTYLKRLSSPVMEYYTALQCLCII